MFLFLSDYLDLLLVVGYCLLLICTWVLIMITRYHIKKVDFLDKQIEYWRQKALRKSNENYRS